MSKAHLATLFWRYKVCYWNPDKPFLLSSGKTSPWYMDCRALLAHPDARWLVAELACAALKSLSFQAVGGLELSAIPMATAISDYTFVTEPLKSCRTFFVRKQVKAHGLGKQIEGAVHPDEHVVVVDDILMNGGSIVQAIRAVREANLHVSHALVILDRGEHDGKQTVEAEGVSLMHLLTFDDLLSARPADLS